MTASKVIVFGPTGAVGSATALTAAELGAKVYLAMRDVEKSIPGLDGGKEKELGFERLYADLTKPDTVKDAVTQSGAQFAFIYLALTSSDHMRSTVEALKSAGIDLVVFLSSLSIVGDIRAIDPSDMLAYSHAQVEVALDETFGSNGYLALRGGSFASNIMWYQSGIKSGSVKILVPESLTDNIVPGDIGRVAGTILTNGKVDDKSHIYIYGPELISFEECVRVIGREIGKMPTIMASSAEEQTQLLSQLGFPPQLADHLTAVRQRTIPGAFQVFGCMIDKGDLNNVEKYSGHPPTTYKEWVRQNRDKFL